MFSKIDVNGENTHPLYAYLKKEQTGILGIGAIKWNFTKFLVDKNGIVVDRFASATKPEDIEKDIIEVAPLAYMRGRTLNDSFIVLDEAQNTTPEQMKMFLTRMGFGSKVVVTGDITQVDLPSGKNSGLMVIQKILADVSGVEFIYLTEKDVVRQQLVQKIIQAYEKFEKNLPTQEKST